MSNYALDPGIEKPKFSAGHGLCLPARGGKKRVQGQNERSEAQVFRRRMTRKVVPRRSAPLAGLRRRQARPPEAQKRSRVSAAFSLLFSSASRVLCAAFRLSNLVLPYDRIHNSRFMRRHRKLLRAQRIAADRRRERDNEMRDRETEPPARDGARAPRIAQFVWCGIKLNSDAEGRAPASAWTGYGVASPRVSRLIRDRARGASQRPGQSVRCSYGADI